jgi:hypothetical protein
MTLLMMGRGGGGVDDDFDPHSAAAGVDPSMLSSSDFLRTIPEDGASEDADDRSSVHHRSSSPSASLPAAGSVAAAAAIARGSRTTAGGNGSFALPGYLLKPENLRAVANNYEDADIDDARSSTRGIIVDPRKAEGGGSGANRNDGTNESAAGTDRAEVAYESTELRLPSHARQHKVAPAAAGEPDRGRDGGAGGGIFGPRPPLNRRQSLSDRWKGLTKRQQATLGGACILTVLVVGAIVSVVVLTTTEASEGGGVPSAAPSAIETIPPSTLLGIDSILYNVSSPGAFEDPTSPQSRARSWLLDVDLLLNDAIDEGSDRLVQRYVCAELVYALGIPQSTLMRDKVECEWPGFSCAEDLPGHKVTNVSFPSMGLRGTLPSELAYLLYLQRLELHNNMISGTLPVKWLEASPEPMLPNLYRLDLSENRLSGSIPEALFTGLPYLSYVFLSDNNLTGSLPEPAASYNGSVYVEELWLQNNHLEGPLPFWMLERFPMLEKLKLGGNSFTGQLPSGTSSAGLVWPTNLTNLDVSSNKLTGSIPLGIFYVPKLRNLSLDTNLFTGRIPDTSEVPLGSTLTHSPLVKLLLHSNQLTGSIPETFGEVWPDLLLLSLHNNTLTGVINETHCANWPSIEEIWADCPGLVSCTCEVCNCSE